MDGLLFSYLWTSLVYLTLVNTQEEAFGIWYQWALFYPPDTPERELLEYVSEKKWLVTVIHHDYKKPEALWDFLFEAGLPLQSYQP